MIMGIVILKKSYKLDKYISVGMITFGIVVCTIVSGQSVVSLRSLMVVRYSGTVFFLMLYISIAEKKCWPEYGNGGNDRIRRFLLVERW